MFKLLQSAFKRLITAVTSPFRIFIVRIQRMFNINVITAKLIGPLTKQVKSLITLRPQSREDYYVIGRFWVYKKLFLTLTLVLCAGIFIYFNMFASPLPVAPAQTTAVKTSVTFDYNDMDLGSYNGIANIRAVDGKVVYTGDVVSGQAKGNGSLWDRNGKLLYEGGFEQNKYNGTGISYYPSGRVKYEGGFAQNLYQGEGVLYTPDGTLLYSGAFAAGVYSGKGKAYSAEGKLLYEGDFSDGLYHGEGIRYYPDGVMRYQGSFFQGKEQGKGILYSTTGKQLYSGEMQGGEINYRSLVHSNLADIEAAFSESPRIFYTDSDSSFVYEQAGIIVTVGCRVLVDTWEQTSTANANQTQYYMPGETFIDHNSTTWQGVSVNAAPIIEVERFSSRSDGYEAPRAVNLSATMTTDSDSIERNSGLKLQMLQWFVGEPSGNVQYGQSSSQNNASSSSSSSSSQSSSPNSSSNPWPEITVEIPKDEKPSFVKKNHTLYYEIDTNVWQSEKELDKNKVPIQKITVFKMDGIAPPINAVAFTDDIPPSMEDCVAIDFIRQEKPTSFSQVVFEMDKQNRLFVRLSNINYASSITRRHYLYEQLTYRYCYSGKDSEIPLFFSIER